MRHLIVGSRGNAYLSGDLIEKNTHEIRNIGSVIKSLLGDDQARIFFSTKNRAYEQTARILSEQGLNVVGFESCDALNVDNREFHDNLWNEAYVKGKLSQVSDVVERASGTSGIILLTNHYTGNIFPQWYATEKGLFRGEPFYHMTENHYTHMDFASGKIGTISPGGYRAH